MSKKFPLAPGLSRILCKNQPKSPKKLQNYRWNWGDFIESEKICNKQISLETKDFRFPGKFKD
jgi:hypothetical protein